MLILIMQLAAFTTLERGSKLNSLSCNYVNFPPPIFLSLKDICFQST